MKVSQTPVPWVPPGPANSLTPGLGGTQQGWSYRIVYEAVPAGAKVSYTPFNGTVTYGTAAPLSATPYAAPAYRPRPPLSPWNYLLSSAGIDIDGFTPVSRVNATGNNYLAVGQNVYPTVVGDSASFEFRPIGCSGDLGGYGIIFSDSVLSSLPGNTTTGAMLYIASAGWTLSVEGTTTSVAGTGTPASIVVRVDVLTQTSIQITWDVDGVRLAQEVVARDVGTWAAAAMLNLTAQSSGFAGYFALPGGSPCAAQAVPPLVAGGATCDLWLVGFGAPSINGNWSVWHNGSFSSFPAYRGSTSELYLEIQTGETNTDERVLAQIQAPAEGFTVSFDYAVVGSLPLVSTTDIPFFGYYIKATAGLTLYPDVGYDVINVITEDGGTGNKEIVVGPNEYLTLVVAHPLTGDGSTPDVYAQLTNFLFSGAASLVGCDIDLTVTPPVAATGQFVSCQSCTIPSGANLAQVTVLDLNSEFAFGHEAYDVNEAETGVFLTSELWDNDDASLEVHPLYFISSLMEDEDDAFSCTTFVGVVFDGDDVVECGVGFVSDLPETVVDDLEGEFAVAVELVDVDAEIAEVLECAFAFVVEESHFASELPASIAAPGSDGVLYCLNTNTLAMTRYTHSGVVGVAAIDGELLLLDGTGLSDQSSSDSVQSAKVETGAINFGDDQQQKFCIEARVYGKASEGGTLTTIVRQFGQTTEHPYPIDKMIGSEISAQRIHLGRGARGVAWGYRIENVSDGSFDIRGLSAAIMAGKAE